MLALPAAPYGAEHCSTVTPNGPAASAAGPFVTLGTGPSTASRRVAARSGNI